MVVNCPCEDGCPSCTGAETAAAGAKQAAVRLFDFWLGAIKGGAQHAGIKR